MNSGYNKYENKTKNDKNDHTKHAMSPKTECDHLQSGMKSIHLRSNLTSMLTFPSLSHFMISVGEERQTKRKERKNKK